MFNTILQFLTVHTTAAYLVLFAGSYFETLIGFGFFVHGEFFFLPGGILAGIGVLNIWLVMLVCSVGGFLGDTSSFFIGKKYGKRITDRLFHEKNRHLTPALFEKAKAVFHRSGTRSIFFARFLGPISWITPFVAGTIDVRYKEFLTYNIPGVILGIAQFVLVGYFLGFSYQLLLGKIQAVILGLVLIAAIAGLFIYIYRGRKA